MSLFIRHLNGLAVWLIGITFAALLMVGCTTSSQRSGGYYGDDRPPQNIPVDLDSIADAIPRHEPHSLSGNKPYIALGKFYRPLASSRGYKQRGIASWYGRKFHGQRTSSGEVYNMFAMTAAHPLLPLPTYVRVTSVDNGKSIIVKVNDRGPFLHNRLIDLSYVAAHKLDILRHGTGRVEIQTIEPHGAPIRARPAPAALALSDAKHSPRNLKHTTKPTTNHAPTILLQVGAYILRDNAGYMQTRLVRAGYQVLPLLQEPLQLQTEPQKTTLYKVRVGPFGNYHAALRNQQKLETLLGHTIALIIQ